MTRTPHGHVEQLPSGSWRAKVYAGKDPLTGRELRFRKSSVFLSGAGGGLSTVITALASASSKPAGIGLSGDGRAELG